MNAAEEWFVRRGARVLGPYTGAQVSRYLLLGRIRHSDRLSRDGEQWLPVTAQPELIPDELRELASPRGWQRYLDALAEVDERGESAAEKGEVGRRRRDDSRQQFRAEWRAALRSAGLAGGERRLMPYALLGVTVAALLVLLMLGASGG